ncbi:HAD hydrolase-like protein [Flavitalea sp. BT771]|uniref:HAD family hydrolase n=1 Tax=Flavitalea sp. BT771 TaxID=3063329 RepID=UPI0026E3C70F|nr:HAD hydrolase-like protein [Flavitalea sp. BT771]MDO6431108.1 HAD hydrolase-like protein [Flavitalea sp. BT771]MDV6220015.1 HAD hydrolase-like protein [Flavitalea sp. BT771]
MATNSTPAPVTALFLDVGGVMLTNGWDRKSREAAAKQFGLDLDDLNDRHRMTFDTYETGKLSLDEYLKSSVFYKDRPFTMEAFRDFMFQQSVAYPEMIGLIKALKAKYKLRIAVVNNEGRELNEHRIKMYKLNEFVDFFISSCFVHFRKPDADIWKIALDIAQVPREEVVYIDDRPMFVQVAQGLGLRGVVHNHRNVAQTKEALEGMGLTL